MIVVLLKQQCRQHYERAKARFDARIDGICPKRVCIHLGYCNKTSLCDKMGGFRKTCEESIDIKPIDKSNSTCVLCEYVMNILSGYIHTNSTEEEIEQSLQAVCNSMPSILQSQCRDYVDNYGPAIIAALLQDFDFSTVCHRLNLCTNQMKIDITHMTKANTAACGVCDYVSTYLQYSLQRDSNEKSLQHALSKVCSHLSDEQTPKCQIIIQLFSPHIRQLELTPENSFCKQLTICQTPMIELKPAVPMIKTVAIKMIEQVVTKQEELKDKKQPLIPEKLSETPQCALCHYVISYLDAALKNNISEQAVEAALAKVCSILPSKFT